MVYWKIEFDTKAQKQFDKLDKQSQKKVQSYLNKDILNLEHPKLFGKALRNNKKGLWRYRVDKFRIICKLEENKLIILIVAIAKRDNDSISDTLLQVLYFNTAAILEKLNLSENYQSLARHFGLNFVTKENRIFPMNN